MITLIRRLMGEANIYFIGNFFYQSWPIITYVIFTTVTLIPTTVAASKQGLNATCQDFPISVPRKGGGDAGAGMLRSSKVSRVPPPRLFFSHMMHLCYLDNQIKQEAGMTLVRGLAADDPVQALGNLCMWRKARRMHPMFDPNNKTRSTWSSLLAGKPPPRFVTSS